MRIKRGRSRNSSSMVRCLRYQSNIRGLRGVDTVIVVRLLNSSNRVRNRQHQNSFNPNSMRIRLSPSCSPICSSRVRNLANNKSPFSFRTCNPSKINSSDNSPNDPKWDSNRHLYQINTNWMIATNKNTRLLIKSKSDRVIPPRRRRKRNNELFIQLIISSELYTPYI